MSDSYKLTIMKDGQWREVGCFSSGSSENSPKTYYVNDIENISNDIMTALKHQDIVVLDNYYVYFVSFKEDNSECSLVHTDSYQVEEVYYDYDSGSGDWVFENKTTVELIQTQEIRSFILATSGTITKAEADEYVRKFCSGWIPTAFDDIYGILVYYAAFDSSYVGNVGDTYLQFYDFANAEYITFKVNANDGLDVVVP